MIQRFAAEEAWAWCCLLALLALVRKRDAILATVGVAIIGSATLMAVLYDAADPNRIQPGKRPRSSMSPTIVLKDGQPFLALGSPGGSTIITTVLQIPLDRIDLNMTMPQAIADPRASQRNGANTGAEPAFLSTPERMALEARGHHFLNAGEIGAATGIEFLTGDGVLAAAEPVRRGGGSAMTELP